MLNAIYKLRFPLLFSLIFLEATFALYTFFDITYESKSYHFIESAGIILILLVALALSNQAVRFQREFVHQESLNNLSPSPVIVYNSATQDLRISDKARRILGVPLKGEYELLELRKFLSDENWDAVRTAFADPKHNKDFKIESIIKLVDGNGDDKLLQLTICTVVDKRSKNYGGAIWVCDVTEQKTSELKVIELIQKYRLQSFELDLVINSMPIPIWRASKDGELLFLNKAAQQLSESLKVTNLNEIIISNSIIFNRLDHNIRVAKRAFTIDNKAIFFNFYEVISADDLGVIYFAFEVNELEDFKKRLKSSAQIIERVLELGNSAILLLDSDFSIARFNQKLVDLFDIDPEWISKNNSYLAFLDKLRETRKLPELKDYIQYREMQIKLLTEISETKHELMHIPGGKTLKMTIVPVPTGSRIIVFDDISSSLNMERSYNELLSVFKETISGIKHAIVIIGQNGRLKYFNPSFLKIWNWDVDQLGSSPHYIEMLENFSKVIPREVIDDVKQNLMSCLEARKNFDIKIPYGHGRSIDLTIKSLPDYSALLIIGSKE